MHLCQEENDLRSEEIEQLCMELKYASKHEVTNRKVHVDSLKYLTLRTCY